MSIFTESKPSSGGSARTFGNGSNIRRMETRSAALRLAYRTESSSATRGRRLATTTSRIRWITSHLTGLVQETQQHREYRGNTAHRRERRNSCEKYDVKTMRKQTLRLNYVGIRKTWILINPGPQKDSNRFASLTENCDIASISRRQPRSTD